MTHPSSPPRPPAASRVASARRCLLSAAAALAAAASATLPTAAFAAEQVIKPLPCTGEPYAFIATGHVTDLTKVWESGDALHVVGVLTLPVSATPVDGSGVTYEGRLSTEYTEDDGAQGSGHVVATFRSDAVLHGSDGSVLRAHEVAHVVATGIPDSDPAALIRNALDHITCIT